MKIIKITFALALATVLTVGCKDTSKDGNIDTNPADTTAADTTTAKETAANLETTSFKIDGMTCPMGCAATIEKKLAGMDGVEKAKVDFDKKTATVSFDPAKQTPEKFVETVEGIADGAYKVSDVKNSGDKAYYNGGDKDKDKKKKKRAEKNTKKAEDKSAKTQDKKASCHSGEKKGGCCASDAKKSCHHEEKGGNL